MLQEFSPLASIPCISNFCPRLLGPSSFCILKSLGKEVLSVGCKNSCIFSMWTLSASNSGLVQELCKRQQTCSLYIKLHVANLNGKEIPLTTSSLIRQHTPWLRHTPSFMLSSAWSIYISYKGCRQNRWRNSTMASTIEIRTFRLFSKISDSIIDNSIIDTSHCRPVKIMGLA